MCHEVFRNLRRPAPSDGDPRSGSVCRTGRSLQSFRFPTDLLRRAWSLRPKVARAAAVVLLAGLFCSCEERQPAPSSGPVPVALPEPVPKPSPGPSVKDYPNLCANADREAAVRAYLRAWRTRSERAGGVAPPERQSILALYADAYQDVFAAADGKEYDRRLRVLWDLCGLAHATLIPPGVIKQAVNWTEPAGAGVERTGELVPAQARDRPVRARVEQLPARVLSLLRGVKLASPAGITFADFVSAHAREAYLTPNLVEWSPVCSLDVCGSCEPLTRTLILTSSSYVDLSPKPDWSLAAVAVHESAHIAWFHRPEVTEDPRLLLPIPNERNAWRLTATFLQGILRTEVSSPLRPHVRTHAGEIRKMLQQARGEVRRANRALRLPEEDQSLRTVIARDVSERDLGLAGGRPGACPAR